MKLLGTITALLLLTVSMAWAESDTPWKNKAAAVSLTYDDSLNVHLDTVIPALKKVKLKGTFYLTTSAPPFTERLKEWRKAAKKGHELGNHTLFHPCEGKAKGREWVSAERDLSTWSKARMIDNVLMANVALEAVDGKTKRTFAYPCGDKSASGESYVEGISEGFVAARDAGGKAQPIDEINLMSIPAYMVNDDSIDNLKKLVDDAIANKTWMVFLFHGVGGEHNLNVSTVVHAELLAYLKFKKKNLWVAPVVNIAEYVQNHQKE